MSSVWSIILVCFADGDLNLDDVNLDNSYGPIKAYSQSKLANVMFSSELARRLAGTAGGLGEWQSMSTQWGILNLNPCNWLPFQGRV
jgi:hypothetical protein